MSDDPRLDRALVRYQVISAYLALEPPRGQRSAVREELASRTWTGPDGEPFHVRAETIRAWVRRYRRGGLEALKDKRRPRRGVQALSPEVVAKVCALKREVPERSLDKLLRILEEMELVAPGTVRRSTLHRVLQAEGLSARPKAKASPTDLDRFEADRPNDLWQSDMLSGPMLPDPERPGRFRRAWLYAFLDDHSRLLLHGRFSFKGDLPALELVFRRALQKYGVPRRVYYDNGQVYRSRHMKQIVAALGIHRIVHTKPYRPQGHGKIEALNRFIRSDFLSELKASDITTLDELNEAFVAWSDLSYNREDHGETDQPPLRRWRADIERIDFADESVLQQAFLWRESRKPDAAGVLSLHGVKFQVGPDLARKRVEVRYDPEDLHEVEIWRDDVFQERVAPFEVAAWRRPSRPEPKAETPTEPVADWLGHLRAQRQADLADVDAERQWRDDAVARREAGVTALVDLLTDRLDPHVVDVPAIRAYAAQYGPFELDAAAAVLDDLLERHPADLHVRFYLDAVRSGAFR